MNGDEHILPGGVYGGEDRMDFYLVEDGPGCSFEPPGAVTYDLKIVTGNAVITIVEISPADIRRLAAWLESVAKERG